MKHRIITFCLILLAFIFVQCDKKAEKESSDSITTTSDSRKENDTQILLLENNGIKIALPDGFERISASGYELFLEANYSKKILEYEKERVKGLRNRDGQFYLYLDEDNGSSLFINVVDPLGISKDNPQGLLNMITSLHTEAKKETQRDFNKITAGFSDTSEISIFKAVYEVLEKNKSNNMYEHSYIITNQDLSMILTLTTPIEIDLDPYIKKIKL